MGSSHRLEVKGRLADAWKSNVTHQQQWQSDILPLHGRQSAIQIEIKPEEAGNGKGLGLKEKDDESEGGRERTEEVLHPKGGRWMTFYSSNSISTSSVRSWQKRR